MVSTGHAKSGQMTILKDLHVRMYTFVLALV